MTSLMLIQMIWVQIWPASHFRAVLPPLLPSHYLSTTALIKLIRNTKNKVRPQYSICFKISLVTYIYIYTHGKLSLELTVVSLLSKQTHVKCFRSFYLLLLLRALSLLGIPSELSLHACQVIHPLIGSQTNECLHKSLFTWLVEWMYRMKQTKARKTGPLPITGLHPNNSASNASLLSHIYSVKRF